MTTPTPPEWATSVPSTDAVHLPPNPKAAVRPVSGQQLTQIGGEFIEQFLKRVVSAVVGIFFPNQKAFEQLAKWADDVGKDIGKAMGDAGKAIGDIVDLAGDLISAPAQVIGSIAGVVMDGVATVGGFLTSLWEGLTGTGSGGSTKTVAQVKAAGGGLSQLAGQAGINSDQALIDASTADGKAVDAQEAAAANAAEIAALKALATGNDNSGNSAFDNFEYVTSSGLNPALWAWASSGTGYVRSDGVRAYWVDSGSSAGTWLGRYTATATITSYQVISTVLNAPLAEAPILGGAQCWNYILGRSNLTMSSFVYLKIGHNTLSIWKVVNGGADILVGEAISYRPRVGDSIQLVLGTGDSVYQFQIKVNNQTVYTVTDSTYYGGVLSVENAATHNFGGMAFAAAPRAGGGQSTPGALGVFALADNTPAPVIGSGMRAYRASTTPADLSSGTNIFPLGWFGQTQDKTPDLTYSSETGRVTVSVEGWYQVVINQYGNSGVGVGAFGQTRAVLYKGVGGGAGGSGDVYAQAAGHGWSNGSGYHGFRGDFLIYLRPGEWIEPGYASTGARSDVLTGDTDGELTWFSVALVNRSYA